MTDAQKEAIELEYRRLGVSVAAPAGILKALEQLELEQATLLFGSIYYRFLYGLRQTGRGERAVELDRAADRCGRLAAGDTTP